MFIYYIDESGCLGTPPCATSPSQPVFVLGGVILRRECLPELTLDWLHLKKGLERKLE